MSFWLALAAMAAVATAWVIVPLWRRRAPADGEDARRDHLRRLRDFEQDLAAGDIDDATAPAVRAEIERAVVEAVADGNAPAGQGGAGRLVGVACAVLVPLLAAAVYLELGEPRIAEFVATHPDVTLDEPDAALELLLERVRERVAEAPGDRQAWTVLARSTLAIGRYDEALAAAEQVVALAPEDVDGLLLLVDAVAMRDGGRFNARAAELIERILVLDPHNATGHILHGIAADQRGDRVAARAAFERALPLLPADAPIRAEIETMLGAAPQAPAAPAAVTVAVTLAPALAADLAPDTPLFVLARAVDGPPLPLAVTRATVADLPLTVTLDESMAMAPGASLADHERVYLVARVARSGQARAASGDYEGRSAEVKPGAGVSVAIEIDAVLP